MADIHQEGRRLIGQAQAVREQWLAAHARMALVQREIEQGGQGRRSAEDSLPTTATHRLLREEREAHARSRLALERELARGRKLEDEVLAIQDQERARLGRDLHDGICQDLAGVTFLLEMHLRQLEGLSPASSQPLQSGRQLREVLSGTIQQLRSLSHGLSGIEVGPQGEHFAGALRTLAERVSAYHGMHCVAVCPDPPALDGTTATHLYRIAQEAISNALRHGEAKHIEICFARAGERWRLSITDDGVGVPERRSSPGGGLGMRSMEYRAAVLGGVLEVRRATDAAPRPGTVVNCTFP